MKPYKILVADDEEQMLFLLSSFLEKEGYEVIAVTNGQEALDKFSSNSIDVVILDVMMPGLDGFTVCQSIRSISNVPIIMLTAKSSENDRINGIKIGADDYLVKPFSPKELVIRIEAIFRRINNFKGPKGIIKIKEMMINTLGQEVMVKNEKVKLTRKEYRLLLFLTENKGKVFTREQLLDHVWGFDHLATLRTVDTHIKTLRLKLGESGDCIKTIWGVGYKLED
ncbi:response regulator transcription factor [Heyndrickxia sp. NPDC080065]|uniref:response regulator transcription factor n=1 Tax=Heyndrickxia sp. NPDC080065 TaxID=3390568 RepID=UPI003D03A773